MVNGVWNGNLNLFKLVAITDATTIFMIISLLLISIYTIKVCNFIADQFKLDNKGKVYFDTTIFSKVKQLFKKEKIDK